MTPEDFFKSANEAAAANEKGEYQGATTMPMHQRLSQMEHIFSGETLELERTRLLVEIYLAWKKFKKHAPGPERARKLHAALDRIIAQWKVDHPDRAAAIRCGKACSACCHIPVGINEDEGELLAERIEAGAWVDMAQLERHAEIPKEQHVTMGFGPESACPFLKPDKTCSVYEDRPGACRRHLVTNDPKWCSDLQGLDRILQANIEEADIVLSGAYNLVNRHGHGLTLLSTQVLTALKARAQRRAQSTTPEIEK